MLGRVPVGQVSTLVWTWCQPWGCAGAVLRGRWELGRSRRGRLQPCMGMRTPGRPRRSKVCIMEAVLGVLAGPVRDESLKTEAGVTVFPASGVS